MDTVRRLVPFMVIAGLSIGRLLLEAWESLYKWNGQPWFWIGAALVLLITWAVFVSIEAKVTPDI